MEARKEPEDAGELRGEVFDFEAVADTTVSEEAPQKMQDADEIERSRRPWAWEMKQIKADPLHRTRTITVRTDIEDPERAAAIVASSLTTARVYSGLRHKVQIKKSGLTIKLIWLWDEEEYARAMAGQPDQTGT